MATTSSIVVASRQEKSCITVADRFSPVKRKLDDEVYNRSVKKIVLYNIVFLALVTPVSADTVIQQGSAQDTIHVSTNIQGSGSVSTHVESTVNGQTKTFDSNTPGSYTIQNNAPGTINSFSNSSYPTVVPTPTISPTPSNTPKPTLSSNHVASVQASVITRVQQFIHNAITGLLSLFHL